MRTKQNDSNESDLMDDGPRVTPPPLEKNEIERFHKDKKITSMIKQSFLKRQVVPGSYKPISESLNVQHGVSYMDENRNRLTGPSYASKNLSQIRMSKQELSARQLDEKTEFYKSKIESLS